MTPIIERGQWQQNLKSEAAAWERWLDTAAAGTDKRIADDFAWRTGPKCDVRDKEIFAPYLRPVCPPGTEARILDVGAGPLTWFPRKWFTRDYKVTAIDPLAGEFDRMLAARNITPPVRTIAGEAETLVEQFGPESFHLVFCRNALEQCHNPMQALKQMLAVAKPNSWVILLQEDPRDDEEKARCPWTLMERDADLYLNIGGSGGGGERVDLGMEFSDVATVRAFKSWHWPWVLGALKKETVVPEPAQ